MSSPNNSPKRRSSLFRARRSLFRSPCKLAATGRLENYYELTSSMLGTGHYGEVWLARCKGTGNRVAVKTVKKKRLSKSSLKTLHREVQVMQSIDHPGIVKMIDFFEDSKTLHIVMEMVDGCDLFDRIMDEGQFNETQARLTLRAMLQSLGYLHSNGIAHRDIKPENIMTTVDANDGDIFNIKLIDFGLSKAMARPDKHVSSHTGESKRSLLHRMTSRVGTPCYMAPEMITASNEAYGQAIDLWSVGCVFYILLSGFPPFFGETNSELFEEIRRADVDFSDPAFDNVSDTAKDLVCGLLTADPSMRLTADEALRHPFFQKELSNQA